MLGIIGTMDWDACGDCKNTDEDGTCSVSDTTFEARLEISDHVYCGCYEKDGECECVELASKAKTKLLEDKHLYFESDLSYYRIDPVNFKAEWRSKVSCDDPWKSSFCSDISNAFKLGYNYCLKQKD